jgi:hypothetical protein
LTLLRGEKPQKSVSPRLSGAHEREEDSAAPIIVSTPGASRSGRGAIFYFW